MDWVRYKDSVINLLKRNIYVVLILIIGIIFMLVPTPKGSAKQTQSTEPTQQPVTLEEQLAKILRCIQGAGEVSVVLTTQIGEEIIYQTDRDASESADTHNTRITTVIVRDEDGNETGLVRQKRPAVYLGAVVICQGADSPSVRLAITEAVSKATGLGADKIVVLKMK